MGHAGSHGGGVGPTRISWLLLQHSSSEPVRWMLRRPMTLPMLAAQPLPCPCPNTHWGAVGPRGLGLGPAHAVPLFPPSVEPPEPRRGSCSLCSPRTELGHQRHAKGIRWAWGTYGTNKVQQAAGGLGQEVPQKKERPETKPNRKPGRR